MWVPALVAGSLVSQCVASILQAQQHPLRLSSSATTILGKTDLIEFHKNITQIESISGNEMKVGEWLVQSLRSQGYTTKRQFISDDSDRFNVIAYTGKEQKDIKVLVTSHIDTVPPFLPYKRFDNGTIFGRGSVDAKASVAAQVIAVNSLLNSDRIQSGDVALLFVVGEEVGGEGMRAANALDLRPQNVVFGEPTEGKLVSGHKGNLGFKLYAKGRAAHSGYPWLGRSANEVMVKSLAALMELAPDLPSSEKYGQTTINLGRIEGGIAGNVVAESAFAQVTMRLAASTPDVVREMVERAVHSAVRSFLEPGMTVDDVVELQWGSKGYGPIDIDHDVPGFESFTVNYGTDIPWFDRTVEGQKRYLYGPGTIFVAHGDHEALTESELHEAVDGYKRIILHALGED